MNCFNCNSDKTRTIYPAGYVQKMCTICGWKSSPVKIPVKIRRVQA